MLNHATGIPTLFLVAGFAASMTATAPAAPMKRPEYRPDGTVLVGSEVFASSSAYHESAAFRASGARCGSHEHRSDPAALVAASDCSFARTTINPDYNDTRVLVIQVVFHVIKK